MSKHCIPEAILKQHIAVLGKTGSGKTSTEKLMIEQVVAQGFRVCVLDTVKSDWWGITSSANGKHPGLPFKILGGPRGHLPLPSSAGKVIGQLVASGKLPLSIIDMADFEAGGIQKFFVEFAPSLMRNMKGVVYLVIEEAHEVAPKERSGFEKENMAIHYAKKLATAGRSKGIRLIVATQRVQSLHNAVLGSCETIIAHRLTTPADQEPILKWLKANADKETSEKVASSISSLPTGTGWMCSGEAKIFKLTEFPKFSTYDNTATPTGDGEEIDVKTAPVNQDELRSILGEAVAEQKANDPAELKRQLAAKNRELAELTNQIGKPQPKALPVAKTNDRALHSEIARLNKCLKVAMRFLLKINAVDFSDKQDREDLKAALQLAVEQGMTKADGVLDRRVRELTKLKQEAERLLTSLKTQTTIEITVDRRDPQVVSPTQHMIPARHQSPLLTGTPTPSSGEAPSGGMKRMLIALAVRPNGLTSKQIGVRAGLSMSGTFTTYMSTLRKNGWIESNGNGVNVITQEGVNALGDYEPLPTGRGLLECWLRKLGNGGSSRMLQAVVDRYPDSLTASEIAEAAGMQMSGTFTTYMSTLRSLELIEGRGNVTASKELFD